MATIRIEGFFVVRSVDECLCLSTSILSIYPRVPTWYVHVYLSRFIEECLCFMQNSYEAVIKKLSEQPFALRLASFIANNFLIIVCSGWRTLLRKARSTRSIPIGPVEIQRKNFILTYSSTMRLGLIFTIYLLNLVNTLLFDSLAPYPVGWILNGIIMLLLERGQECSSKLIEMLVFDKKRLRKPFVQVAVVYGSIYFRWVRNFSRLVVVDDTGYSFEIDFSLLFIAIHTDAGLTMDTLEMNEERWSVHRHAVHLKMSMR